MQPPILGFRKDRLGGRLVTLINCMALAQRFGTDSRFWWWTGSSDDAPLALDAAELFSQRFIDDWLILSGDIPDMARRANLVATRSRMGTRRFADALAAGQSFYLDDGFQVCRFNDESAHQAQNDFSAAAAMIDFSDAVAEQLFNAQVLLQDAGGEAHALHVRRGDLISNAPWCATSWTAKYLPEEHATAYVEAADAPVIVFSDTREVADRLTKRHRHAVSISDLVDMTSLKPAQRDLVELLLMARCRTIAAPTLSAFSNGACIYFGAHRVTLPRDLPPGRRRRADEALMQRVVTAPGSFLCSGDLAQSTAFAHSHALATGQTAMLRATIDGRLASDGAMHPQLFALQASLALSEGDMAATSDLVARGEAEPKLWERDRKPMRMMGLVADHAGAADPVLRADAEWRFGIQHFARWQNDARADAVSSYFFSASPALRDWFMMDGALIEALTENGQPGQLVAPAPLSKAPEALSTTLPFWVTALDWLDLFEPTRIGAALRHTPDFHAKECALPAEARAAEASHQSRRSAPPADPALRALMGFHAQVLRLHGKFRRAARVLEALSLHDPDCALTRKRLADLYFDMDDKARGLKAMHDAVARAPDHSGMNTAMGLHLSRLGDQGTAARFLQRSVAGEMPLRRAFSALQHDLKTTDQPDLRREVCARAARLFPEEPRFARIAARLARKRA